MGTYQDALREMANALDEDFEGNRLDVIVELSRTLFQLEIGRAHV